MKSVIKSKMYLVAVAALLWGMLSLSACGGGGDDPAPAPATNNDVTGYLILP